MISFLLCRKLALMFDSIKNKAKRGKKLGNTD